MTQTAEDVPAAGNAGTNGTTGNAGTTGNTSDAAGVAAAGTSAGTATAAATTTKGTNGTKPAEPPHPAKPTGAGRSNPLARLLAYRTTPTVLRWATLASLIANIGIIVTGGAVRLTDSGLGCPTWPTCTDGSLVPTSQLGAYGIVEFSNRMLTPGVSIAVGAALLACLRFHPRRATLTKFSWWLFIGVVVQAIIGGISVRTHLAPIWVALHMVVSLGMVAVSYALWVRSGEPNDTEPTPTVQPFLRQLGYVLTGVMGALLIAGTIVTGSGPHSGAKAGDPGNKRFPLSPTNATQLHADLVFLAVGLTIALWFALKATNAAPRILITVRDLFLVLMAQGVIGYVQYFTHLPVLLVGLHMFGSAMVWVATWRVLLAMRERKAEPAAVSASAAAASA